MEESSLPLIIESSPCAGWGAVSCGLCWMVSFKPWNPRHMELQMLSPVFSSDLIPIDSLVYLPWLWSSDSDMVFTFLHDHKARGLL